MPFDNYSNLPKPVQQYLYYLLTIKGRSPRTVNAYAIDLRGFFRFLKQHRGLVQPDMPLHEICIQDVGMDLIRSVTLLDAYEYLNVMMREHGNAAKARARKVSSLRGLYKYLTINRMIEDNPLEHLEMPSLPKTMPKYLSREQSKHLLDATSELTSDSRLRDYCILTFFLNCGMRLSELVGINLSSINQENYTLKLLGKGNKERMVYLNEACLNALDKYLTGERAHLHIVDKDALFLSVRSGKRLGARQVQNIVQKMLKQAGLSGKGYSTHKLRHTAATLLYQYGQVDILTLKELLGHVNVGTTEIYTHVSNETVKQAVEKNPLAHETIGAQHTEDN